MLTTDYSQQDRLLTGLIDTGLTSKNRNIGTHNPAGRYYYKFAPCFEFTDGWLSDPATFSYELGRPGIAALNALEGSMHKGLIGIRSKAVGNFKIKNISLELSTDFKPVVTPAPGAFLLVTIGTAIVGYLRTRKII